MVFHDGFAGYRFTGVDHERQGVLVGGDGLGVGVPGREFCGLMAAACGGWAGKVFVLCGGVGGKVGPECCGVDRGDSQVGPEGEVGRVQHGPDGGDGKDHEWGDDVGCRKGGGDVLEVVFTHRAKATC